MCFLLISGITLDFIASFKIFLILYLYFEMIPKNQKYETFNRSSNLVPESGGFVHLKKTLENFSKRKLIKLCT